MKTTVIDGTEILMEKKKVKNINLTVKSDGVHISVPTYVSYGEAENFARSKIQWIKKALDRLSVKEAPSSQFLSGETVFVSGKPYILEVFTSERKKSAVLGENTLFIYAKENSTPEDRCKNVERLYADIISEKIPPLMEKWEKIIGVKSSGWRLRSMKTRWGICNIKTHEICFNTRLGAKSDDCLEYIVVHELCHLLEGSHNAVFKAHMDSFLPDWRNIKKRLNSL